MILFTPITRPVPIDRTRQVGSDCIRHNTMRLAPNLVVATNRVREAIDDNTPFSRKVFIFQEEINDQITRIENSKDKYLKSKKLIFLEKHPFLKSNNDDLFKKLKSSQHKLSEALSVIYEQNLDTLPTDIANLLSNTQDALTACKDSLTTISGYETKSISDKRFALGAVFVNFVSAAVVPCIMQLLSASSVIPASIAAAGLASVSAFLSAPVLTAIVCAAIGVATLAVGVWLYRYYKNRSLDPSHKLDNTTLALEELSRCLTVMDESLAINVQPIVRDINTPQLAPLLTEALSDENITAFTKFLTLLIDNREVLRGLDKHLDVDEAAAIAAMHRASRMASATAINDALPAYPVIPAVAALPDVHRNIALVEHIARYEKVRELTHF